MFKRTIELNVVKKRKKNENISDEPVPTIEDLAELTVEVMSDGARKLAKLVVAYIALDTARKVVIGRYGK